MHEITVRNWRRSRSFGWAWSCTPTGEDAYSIEIPSRPDYTGTYGQVVDAMLADRTFASIKGGGGFYATAWFYKGGRIVATQIARDDWWQGFIPETDARDPDITIRVE